MRFIQIRNLRQPEVWEQLADEREMVITAQENRSPFCLMFPMLIGKKRWRLSVVCVRCNTQNMKERGNDADSRILS